MLEVLSSRCQQAASRASELETEATQAVQSAKSMVEGDVRNDGVEVIEEMLPTQFAAPD